LATGLTCRRALAAFTSQTLHLLATARVVVLLVFGALLFSAQGDVRAVVVSATLVWLVGDRLLGRDALYGLWQRLRGRT
jgi:hypothetical protein